MLLLLTACSSSQAVETVTETASDDLVAVLELAESEFFSVFSEYDGLEITDTTTMARSDDSGQVLVQFGYTSENGSGVYGFLIGTDESWNYTILEHGETLTVDRLLESEN